MAFRGVVHGFASSGGAKRSGGESAKGMPRNYTVSVSGEALGWQLNKSIPD